MGIFRTKYLLSVAVILLFVQFVFGSVPTLLAPNPSVGTSEQNQQDSTRNRRRELRQAQRQNSQRETVQADTLEIQVDTTEQTPKKASLNKIISGKAKDSLYYDMRNKKVYMYEESQVTYDNMTLSADFVNIDLDKKNIYAFGKADTVDGVATVTRPSFTQSGSTLNMDTITYNIESQRAKIKGIATQQGDGWLISHDVKKMEDNSINMIDGMYTTCDQTENPHFYYYISKGKVITGDKGKIIMGPGHLVFEEVDIPFLGLPEGFFPLSSGPKSGILMPSYGEEARRGFYLRDLGYYFSLSDHMDLALTGGFYTLGSWEVGAASRYIKRYKYSGNLNFKYASIRTGDKGDPDFIKQNTYNLQWSHTQDPKANPGSTFSASVNLASSGYSKYSATNLNDMLATQTNSSISYSKNWAGTPFSLSMSMAVSQNSQTEAISATLLTYHSMSRNSSLSSARSRRVKIVGMSASR